MAWTAERLVQVLYWVTIAVLRTTLGALDLGIRQIALDKAMISKKEAEEMRLPSPRPLVCAEDYDLKTCLKEIKRVDGLLRAMFSQNPHHEDIDPALEYRHELMQLRDTLQ